jgi:uncharacterized protein (TIGR03435 family)
MLQAILEERFQLKIHRETRDVPVYALTIAKGGPKLRASKPDSCVPIPGPNDPLPPPGKPGAVPENVPCGFFHPTNFDPAHPDDESKAHTVGVDTNGQTMAGLCRQFSVHLDRDVVNRTGLTGAYDIHLDLTMADLFPTGPRADAAPGETPNDFADSIFAAVQKLGLKLESSKEPATFLVIDHVERPSGN